MPEQDITNYFELLKANFPPALRLFCAKSADEFSDAVELAVENAMQHMEAGAVYNHNRDERALTHELAGCLGGGGVHVQNEAHSNGHVDITVAHPSNAAWRTLGECKLYHGPAYHVAGCKQILNRYATGRLPRTFCLDFVQVDGIRDKMEGIRDYMDHELPHQQQASTADHRIRWAFTTRHHHSSGEDVAILHLGCNVHHAQN